MASIYKRGAIWWSDLYFRGSRLRKPLSRDKRVAEKKLADLIKQRDGERYGHAAASISFQAFKERLFAHLESRLDPKTQGMYRRAFKDVTVASPAAITPEYLERLIAAWQQRQIGRYEINARIRCIKAAMRRAEVWGYCASQRWDTVKQIKTPKGRLHYYSIEDAKNLLNECDGPWRTVVLLGLYTGLRRSEIAALRWEDVDFARKRIHVVPYDGFTPKDFERRWIPMAETLEKHLRRLGKDGIFVLGRRYHVGVLTTYLRRIIHKAELTGSVHTLRHTFAAWLASAGVPLFTLSRLLGHSSVKTTEIYAHLAPDSQASAVAVLPKI